MLTKEEIEELQVLMEKSRSSKETSRMFDLYNRVSGKKPLAACNCKADTVKKFFREYLQTNDTQQDG